MGVQGDGGGLRLTFDPALDGPGWPGPFGDRVATFGDAWLGPLGLLDRLETELGLLALRSSAVERAAELSRALVGRDGFWARSFEADPLSTSRRLLDDRDLMALWGWRGEAASERLGALWQATSAAGPGIADRLQRVIEMPANRRVDIESIRVVDPVETMPPVWQRVFASLAERGVRIEHAPLAVVSASGDLRGARAPGFSPTGDGSLQLVRPHGPLAAADEVAAALAASDSLADIVVIGSDAILDSALARHGLPRLGARVDGPGSTALVRLVIETAFKPMDAADLHALLCIDPGPVPRSIRSGLAYALGRFPGRGSGWRDALAAGLAKIDDVARRERVAARLAALLEPVADRDAALSSEQLVARVRALTEWARGRLERDPSLLDTITQAERMLALAKLAAPPRLDRATLRRLCDETARASFGAAVAEYGLASVYEPGAILAPIRTVVWWGFTRESAPRAPRLRLSLAERAALTAAGVTSPDLGAVMFHEARRWRRPLDLASDAVVLVCPQTDEAGEPAHAHPLWDELRANLTQQNLATRLSRPHIALPAIASRASVARRPLPRAFDVARAPIAVAPRNPESPSSLEKLLGCSLAYTLHYPGAIRAGMSGGPQGAAPILFGNIAHHILAQVFGGETLAPDPARARAEELLDAQLPELAELLLLPEHQVERAALRRSIALSARVVASLLATTGATIRGVELELEGTLGALGVKGTTDLLLSKPDFVIDYKWGATSNRERLKAGAALQLAAYAELGRAGSTLPDVAYFVIRTQRILGTPGIQLPDAIVAGPHSAEHMLAGTLGLLATRIAELATGHLVAPSAVVNAEKSSLARGQLALAPACGYCDLGGLCGRRGRV